MRNTMRNGFPVHQSTSRPSIPKGPVSRVSTTQAEIGRSFFSRFVRWIRSSFQLDTRPGPRTSIALKGAPRYAYFIGKLPDPITLREVSPR
jgi:hypothetical protein